MRLNAKRTFALLVSAVAVLAAASSVAKADSIYTSQTAFNSATSGDTSVGFPSPGYGTFTPAGPTYTLGAVSFTTGSGSTTNLDDAAYYLVNGGSPANPTNYLITFGQTPTDTLTVTFPSSTAFSLDLGGTFGPGEQVSILLSDGFTYNYTATGYVTSGLGLDFLGFSSSTPLTSATLTFEDDGANFFGTVSGASYGSVTPEPSSLLLLATGLAALCLLVRGKLVIRQS
jgi:hypothetical protein